jgi:hypothetical protein
LRARTLTGIVVGGLLIGSALTTLVLPSLVAAADPTAAPTATPSATGTPTADQGGHGGFGRDEAISDTSVVAKAIGITESALTTELGAGKTVADVAKAHSVAVQTVIDALVADGKSELAAAVKAGTITQAQADAEMANLAQRATDQVNGTFGPGGMGGPGGGHGGFGHDGFGYDGGQPGNGATPSASPTTAG